MEARIQQLLDDFAGDDRSGSAELAQKALKIMLESALSLYAGGTLDRLDEITSSLLRGQPSMAAVRNIVQRVYLELFRLKSPASRSELEAIFSRLKADISQQIENTVEQAVSRLKGFEKIATYSRSSLVERALLRLNREGVRLEVVVSEGRPGLEGVTLAETLAKNSLDVTLCVDAALPELIKGCGALVIGADAVTTSRFCNKIGSGAMCRAAVEGGVPVFVITTADKFLPEQLESKYRIIDRPPEEIVNSPPPNIKIVNRLFEWVDNLCVNGFISAEGLLKPDEVEKLDAFNR